MRASNDVPRLVHRAARVATGVFLLVAPASAAAQAPVDTTFEVRALHAPTAPAFVVLGVEPTSVERPASPRAFAASLLSATQGGTVIPENYAVQVTPYWLTPRPALEFANYFDPGAGQALLQSLSFSAATSASDTSTAVGFGVRAVPFPGRPGSRLVSTIELLDALHARHRRLPEELGEAADATEEAAVLRRIAAVDDSLRVLADRLKEMDHDRVGFVLQLASGVAAAFPGNAFDVGAISRIGVWTTLGYRLEQPQLDLLGLLRYQRNRAADQDLIDVGARVVGQLGRLALSGEFVMRSATDVTTSPANGGQAATAFESSRRVVGVLEYRATDDLVLVTSFGRDFALEDGGAPLVAILGLDVLLGRLPEILTRRRQ